MYKPENYTLTGNPVLYTFPYTGTLAEGDAVALNSSGYVTRGAPGDPFFGVVHKIEGTNATVQVRGAMAVKYSGATLPRGAFVWLTVDGTGKVALSETSGSYADVLDVDTSSTTVAVLR